MPIKIRGYNNQAGYSEDFHRVCDFLIRINRDGEVTPHYLWARWVWQFGPYMAMEHLGNIGLALDGDKMVGLATYEGDIGEAYFCADPAYAWIKPQLMDYAMAHLKADGKLKITLPDGDLAYQQAAVQRGFIPSNSKTSVGRIDLNGNRYTLPHGYRIISFDDPSFDVDKYYQAIWRGFDNTRERNACEMESMINREGFDAPHLNPSLRILVVAPNGDYAAHCGMWYLPGDSYAYVEPVFTLPEYRRLGLGKAAVIEGLNRCEKLGATHGYVGSSQQFYYSIGFYPYQNETWWTINLA